MAWHPKMTYDDRRERDHSIHKNDTEHSDTEKKKATYSPMYQTQKKTMINWRIRLFHTASWVLGFWILIDLPILPDIVYIDDLDQEDFYTCVWWNANISEIPIADWDYYSPNKNISVKEPTLHLDPNKCSEITLNTNPPPRRPPSYGACDGYNGVFHIQNGDIGGASGTAFFLIMIGMLQWADQHNYIPWVHLNYKSIKIYDPEVHGQGPVTNFTMLSGMEIGSFRDKRDPDGCLFPGRPNATCALTPKEFVVEGTGIWEHYFEPVSSFSPGDPSCRNKPLVTMDQSLVSDGIHRQAPWTPRAWRYRMPEYIAQPNISLEEWFAPMRRHAADTTHRYIRFNQDMEQRAACAHPNPENSLGIHIRQTDKYLERDVFESWDFLPYCEAFVKNGGGDIFLATDSAKVVKEIEEKWPKYVSSHVVRQRQVKALSDNDTAAFDLGHSMHQSNTEALTDILALSKCTYLVHGLSAFSDAALFLNPGLQDRALNLEANEAKYTAEYFTKTILPRGRTTKA